MTVPLEAPLRHANGCHWGRFVRTIVEVETDNGLVGLGEMGGGGESADARSSRLKTYSSAAIPRVLEEMRFLLANPTASLYNNRTQIAGRARIRLPRHARPGVGVPVCDILGGHVARPGAVRVAICSSGIPSEDGRGEVRTADQLVAHARELKPQYGFTSHKLKGGVFPPEYELECYRALAAAFPGDRFRFDPNARVVDGAGDPVRQAIEDLDNDYLEDPVYGLNGMRRAREKSACRSPRTQSSSTSSSSRRTCSTPRST